MSWSLKAAAADPGWDHGRHLRCRLKAKSCPGSPSWAPALRWGRIAHLRAERQVLPQVVAASEPTAAVSRVSAGRLPVNQAAALPQSRFVEWIGPSTALQSGRTSPMLSPAFPSSLEKPHAGCLDARSSCSDGKAADRV